MKKFLDRYLFSRLGLQLAFSTLAIGLFALLGTGIMSWTAESTGQKAYSRAFWGFRQITDSGSRSGTLDKLDQMADKERNGMKTPVVMAFALASWLVGVVLYGFVAGAVSNAFARRKEKIDAGLVRYRFRGHGLVIGWDFQGASCVKALLGECREVLVASARAAGEIRGDLEAVLGGGEMSRVFICNGQIAVDKSLLRDVWPELAKKIVILGDRNGDDTDGGNLYLERLLRRRIKAVHGQGGPVKVFLHLANPELYANALSIPKEVFSENGGDGEVDLEVFNYHESWAWRCWSLKGASDGDGDAYLPLRHRPDAERVELFFLGGSRMGQEMARYAMPLLNYGEDWKHCKITVFDEVAGGGSFLPEQRVLDAMPEVEVEVAALDGGSAEANDIMIAAASDPKTAVTIVVATPGPDAAVRAYVQLPNRLRRMDVSILVWQATATEKCPRKPFMQACGDCAKLRFFGMTDVLPWLDPARQAGGCVVNHCYDVIFGEGLPEVSDPRFAELSKSTWNPARAEELWRALPRWKQWSSTNAADAFREKAAVFPDFGTNAETRSRLMHAEHNRWWTERLLTGWQPCRKPVDKAEAELLKASYKHWDMVSFDQLDEFTRGLDRVAVAAMAILDKQGGGGEDVDKT